MKILARWRKRRSSGLKLTAFTVTMLLILAGLVVVFSEYRSRDTHDYHAVFDNVSGLGSGDKVRIAGVEVGQVGKVAFTDGNRVLVDFDVDARNRLAVSTRAQVRYENLTGDRYLELLAGESGADGTRLDPGGTLPVENTAQALDLDRLLGGFRPLFAALTPDQVNQLSASLVNVFQGQGGSIESILRSTAELTRTLGERDQLISQVIGNLNALLGTLDAQADRFDSVLDDLQRLVHGLGSNGEQIGGALGHMNAASGTLADMLLANRPRIQGTVNELQRTATQLDLGRDEIAQVVGRLPSDFRKMARLGVYGGFFNFYLCGVIVRITGGDGKPLYMPQYEQTTGRCAP